MKRCTSSSVAAAAIGHDGRPTASLGLTFRSDRADDAQRVELAELVVRAAREVTRRLARPRSATA